jgi:hypothetical protein
MFVDVGGVEQPRPAPRFSRTPTALPKAPHASTRDEALAALRTWFGAERYDQLDRTGQLAAVQGGGGN